MKSGNSILISSEEEAVQAFAALETPGRPHFFQLSAQLPKAGRTNIPVAATNKMNMMLKTYAASGENGLHAHINEDHAFVILSGKATFYGPNDEQRLIGKYEGVMLPKGTLYRFKSEGEEPLVLLRIGCLATEGEDIFARVDNNGNPMAGNSTENKETALELSPHWFGFGIAEAA